MAILIYIVELLFYVCCILATFWFLLYAYQWIKRNKNNMKVDNTKKKKKRWSVFEDKKIIDGTYKESETKNKKGE